MPEASRKIFWTPGGPGGPVFLKEFKGGGGYLPNFRIFYVFAGFFNKRVLRVNALKLISCLEDQIWFTCHLTPQHGQLY